MVERVAGVLLQAGLHELVRLLAGDGAAGTCPRLEVPDCPDLVCAAPPPCPPTTPVHINYSKLADNCVAALPDHTVLIFAAGVVLGSVLSTLLLLTFFKDGRAHGRGRRSGGGMVVVA